MAAAIIKHINDTGIYVFDRVFILYHTLKIYIIIFCLYFLEVTENALSLV